MSDRIDPIRRTAADQRPIKRITPVTRRHPDREHPHNDHPPEQRREPPPDDGLPHIDVTA